MKRAFLAFAFVSLIAAPLRAAETTAQFKSGDETVSAFLATPAGKGPFPGVIVIHEWWGLDAWVKDQARALAKEGYAALAVLAEGVKKANTFDSARVADAIRALDLNTLVGHVTYDANGDLKEQHVYVFQVKDGAFIQAYPK